MRVNIFLRCAWALAEISSVTFLVTVLVDKDNYIQYILTGYKSADDLLQAMNKFASITTTPKPEPTTPPAGTPALSDIQVSSAFMGGSHSASILADGSLCCWGNNSSGQMEKVPRQGRLCQ